MKVYEVQVTRDGKWWMVAIPELDGLTQARRLSEATEMARSYIAVTLDISPESFDVKINLGSVDGVSIDDALATIAKDREEARRLEREASQKAVALAKALAYEGVPLRDVGTILEVSHQRAHQLVNA